MARTRPSRDADEDFRKWRSTDGGALVESTEVKDASLPPRPRRVLVAAALTSMYALAAGGMAIALLWQMIAGTGGLGDQHLGPVAVFGVAIFALGLNAFVAVLITGARRAAAGRSRGLLVVPLLVFIAAGSVGEMHDMIGSESTRSNVIGATILVLAAVPVAIVYTPASRTWFSRVRSQDPRAPGVSPQARRPGESILRRKGKDGASKVPAAIWVVLAALFGIIVVVPALPGIGTDAGRWITFLGFAISIPIWLLVCFRVMPTIDPAKRVRSEKAVQRAQRLTFWAFLIVAEGTWISAWLAMGAL